jgi:hypothetical protein
MAPQYGYGPPQMEGGIWRHGELLVMHKMAQLPDVCVKSGEPTKTRLKRNLQWFNPLIYLALLVNVLVFAVLASILAKRATIYIGLSEYWLKRRRNAILAGWLIGLAGTATFIGSFVALAAEIDWWWALMLLSIVLMIFGLCWGQYRGRMVHPHKIDEQYVWLKGVHPNVLAMFPAWPYPVS